MVTDLKAASEHHIRGRFDHEDRSSIIDHLRREDWNPLLVEEPAGYTYTPHHHAEAKLIVVLEGEMEVTLAGTVLRCRPGDELTWSVPPTASTRSRMFVRPDTPAATCSNPRQSSSTSNVRSPFEWPRRIVASFASAYFAMFCSSSRQKK